MVFDRFIRILSQYCDRIAQIGVVAMMLLVVANILLRIVWHAINGTYDFVCFIGALLVAFALAYCAVKKGHIEVEMVVAHLPQRVQGIIGSFTGVLSLGLFILVTWQSVLFANDMWQKGETTMTALLPFYPYIYGIAFGCVLLCLVILADLIKSLVKAVKG
jgi:TRAP-type C4-dicarboxylate transport system permease small subunit